MSDSYSPPGESSADLWLERSNFAGMLVGGVAYGIHASVFAAAVYYMTRGGPQQVFHRGFLAFAAALFILGTINVAANTKFSQMMWIDDRAIAGGPNAWLAQDYTNPVNILGNAAYIFSNFLADGMIIYRLWIVWSYNYYVAAIPFLTFLASTALSILTIYQSARPGASLWSRTTIAFAVPYWSLSIALNILATLVIAARLLVMMRRIRQSGVGMHHARMYTSITAMVVESAALYSITGLIFIICYARNSNVQNIVLPVLGQVMCIAPELILLRVARGRAWSHNTGRTVSSSVFIPNTKAHTGSDILPMYMVESARGQSTTAMESASDFPNAIETAKVFVSSPSLVHDASSIEFLKLEGLSSGRNSILRTRAAEFDRQMQSKYNDNGHSPIHLCRLDPSQVSEDVIQRIIQVMGQAFAGDLFTEMLVCDQVELFADCHGAQLRACLLAGEVWVAGFAPDKIQAATLWFGPGQDLLGGPNREEQKKLGWDEFQAKFPEDRMRQCSLANTFKSWHLQLLGVATEHQRKGLGRALIDAVREKARAQNLGMSVETETSNSLQFYKSVGFVVQGQTVISGYQSIEENTPKTSPMYCLSWVSGES
ncbi:hypothetical protein EW146_g9025 [Bondarzewia mesenterica]|uniref:N-acetyltransferase domain-containing protein n=1 Tax=Bondarzewia mesenterica TaxID=1095465 RepID=A0A4S4LBJ5_9AGAM|nr:hypothetical protein EW146_g9025 [Bondarzewia mesenterica]